MKNWDSSDALGKTACNISQDFEDMKLVCKKLNMEAVEVSAACFTKSIFMNLYFNRWNLSRNIGQMYLNHF